jgi:hypothetical protein
MRYKRVEDVDPAWLAHHFAWERGPDGADRLAERKGFVPIPYRGELSVTPGSVSSYRLEPARAALCDALIAFLASEFRAERLTVPDDYHHPLRVDGQQVTVGCFPDHGYVDVQAEYGATDLRVLETIARRFDAELATGEYDALFEQ